MYQIEALIPRQLAQFRVGANKAHVKMVAARTKCNTVIDLKYGTHDTYPSPQ